MRGMAIGRGCPPCRVRQSVQGKGAQGAVPVHGIPHEGNLRRRKFEKGGQGISTANRKWEERVLRKAPKGGKDAMMRAEDGEMGRRPGLQSSSKALHNRCEKCLHRPPTD
jgi:hypothetical protein